MIWRDDDIGFATPIEALSAVDDLFQDYGVKHTIAVMAKAMDKRPELVDCILERGMIVQLHCWTHLDLTKDANARAELAQAVEMVERLFGHPPSILYPPWNRTSDELTEAAAALGMSVSHKKISLDQFIRAGGDVAEDTCNFHYWAVQDVARLDRALRIGTGA